MRYLPLSAEAAAEIAALMNVGELLDCEEHLELSKSPWVGLAAVVYRMRLRRATTHEARLAANVESNQLVAKFPKVQAGNFHKANGVSMPRVCKNPNLRRKQPWDDALWPHN